MPNGTAMANRFVVISDSGMVWFEGSQAACEDMLVQYQAKFLDKLRVSGVNDGRTDSVAQGIQQGARGTSGEHGQPALADIGAGEGGRKLPNGSV